MTTALQNFIELFTIPFQAGESKLFMVSGQYFELVDATNPVDVLLLSRNGEQRGIMRGAEASFHLKNTDFQQVQITSATAQTIRIGYGSGEAGTRRAAGAVSIVGTVPVSGPLTDPQLRATPVQVRTAEAPSGTWVQSGAIPSNTAQLIFSPAANVNGAILWNAAGYDFNTGVTAFSFVAKATAPTGIIDGDVVLLSQITAYDGTGTFKGANLAAPARIAAGLGLYFVASFATNAGGSRHARYTLLP